VEENKNKIYYYVANNSNSIYRPLRRTLIRQKFYSAVFLAAFAAIKRHSSANFGSLRPLREIYGQYMTRYLCYS
jgi:hypothetical protein